MKRTWVGIAIVLLICFLVLTATVHLRFWERVDWAALIALQSMLPRLLDVPFALLSLLGSAEATGLMILAIVCCVRAAQRVPLILSMGFATLVELIGKTVINQPTTPDELVRYVPLLPMLSGYVNPGFSYPSGHAVRTTFIVIILATLIAASHWRRSTKATFYVLLAISEIVMLVSRVYLAEHWLTDVIGGALLGAACAVLALNWEIDFMRNENPSTKDTKTHEK